MKIHTLPARCASFTLIELSIVVMVLGLLAAAALKYAAATSNANNVAATNATLDVIEAALLNFRIENGQLPCPADVTVAENASGGAFGVETDTAEDGYCYGFNFTNSYDPDGPTGNCFGGIPTAWTSGVCNPGAPDPNYDATSLSQVVIGAVPTRTLKIADKYAYDAWGRKIWYAIDKRYSANNAFATYTVSSGTGAIVIKKTETDLLANAIAINAIYVLVSAGPDGHGAYNRNVNTSANAQRFNSGSTNIDEQTNCHCDNTASSSAAYFSRIFVQKIKTVDPTTLTNTFDDIVRYKTRAEVIAPSEQQ